MGTKIIRALKVLSLILLSFLLLFFGSKLLLIAVFGGEFKWDLVIDVIIPALGCYLIAKDLFVVKWKEKEGLQNGENQSK